MKLRKLKTSKADYKWFVSYNFENNGSSFALQYKRERIFNNSKYLLAFDDGTKKIVKVFGNKNCNFKFLVENMKKAFGEP